MFTLFAFSTERLLHLRNAFALPNFKLLSDLVRVNNSKRWGAGPFGPGPLPLVTIISV